MRWNRRLCLALCGILPLLGLLVMVAFAQQPTSPQEQLSQCQWDVRQLRAGREQAEKNVSILGAQLEKLQAELIALKEKPAEKGD